MKSYSFAPLFVAAVTAQLQGDYGPNCGITNIDKSQLQGVQLQTIGQALIDINSTTTALNNSLLAFSPSDAGSIANTYTASSNVINQILSSNATVAALTPLEDNQTNEGNTLDLTTLVASLACNVNRTVNELIFIKQELIDACVATLVLQQITAISDDTNSFVNTTNTIIPAGVVDLAASAIQPIKDALANGVSAFAGQTTAPASCTASSTTSATSTSGAGSTTTSNGGVYPTGGSSTGGGTYPTGGSSTGGGTYPTGGSSTGGGTYPTGGSSTGGGTYPTGGSSTGGGVYPTGGSYTTTTDDCEDDEPTSVYTTGGGSYPTGGYSSGGSGGSYSTGGSYTTTEDDCEDDEPTSGYSTGGGSYPTGGYTSGGAGGSYTTSKAAVSSYTTGGGVYTTPVVPPTSGPVATYTTSTGPIQTYAGAAVANGADGFGAVAFVAAVVAML